MKVKSIFIETFLRYPNNVVPQQYVSQGKYITVERGIIRILNTKSFVVRIILSSTVLVGIYLRKDIPVASGKMWGTIVGNIGIE
jgi:hypothetical protein